jgi:hypothetical protein
MVGVGVVVLAVVVIAVVVLGGDVVAVVELVVLQAIIDTNKDKEIIRSRKHLNNFIYFSFLKYIFLRLRILYFCSYLETYVISGVYSIDSSPLSWTLSARKT